MTGLSNENFSLEKIEQFDTCLSAFAAYWKKARSRVARFKKVFGAHPSTKELAKVINDLNAFSALPSAPNLPGFIDELKKWLVEMRHALGDRIGERLQKACVAGNLAFKPVADGFGIGPFLLTLDPAKEAASLSYARVIVAKDIPIDPSICVAQAKSLKAAILDEPSNLEELRPTFEEAMRVALARKNKPTRGDLRVELPQVFREMELIRQSKKSLRSTKAHGYSLPNFVVEISRLLRSKENLESKNPFRPETAVLENTKDNRRSIFIPHDLSCGFGEGTYFQAVTLHRD